MRDDFAVAIDGVEADEEDGLGEQPVQCAAYHDERGSVAIRELEEVGAALVAVGAGDAQAFAGGGEGVPFSGRGHGGAYAVETEVAEGEEELRGVDEPGVEEDGAGEGEGRFGGCAPGVEGCVEERGEEGGGEGGAETG